MTGRPSAEPPAGPPLSRHMAFSPNNFDALRLGFAVLVIFSHSFALLHGGDHTDPLMRVSGQLPLGAVALDAFFVISGYLVTQSLLHSSGPFDYLARRARRIYPGFIVACLFCGLVVAPLAVRDPATAFEPLALVKLVAGSLALRGMFVENAFLDNPFPHAINGSLWSIAYEAWCYVGLLVLGLTRLLKPRATALLFGLSIAASVVFDVLRPEPHVGIFGHILGWPSTWARLLPFYLAGTVYSFYRDSVPLSNIGAVLASLGLVVGALVPHGLTPTLPILGSYLLFWFAFHPAIKLSKAAKYGDFSYGVYLYAFPIQQLLVSAIPGLTPLTLFALATPLSVLFGALSWHLVEKRMAVSRARRAERQAAAATP
jgi:peptidoglycan/LPS O-acetylase OafA/YrhL